jgi:predicted nucleic acid-binding protein
MLINGKRDGHIPLVKQILNQLINAGFFLDPHGTLYQEALRLAGEA